MHKIKEFLPTVLLVFYISFLSIKGDANYAELGIFACLSAILCYNMYRLFIEHRYNSKNRPDELAPEKTLLEKRRLEKEIRELEDFALNIELKNRINDVNLLKVDVEHKRLINERTRYNKALSEEGKIDDKKIKF